MSVPAASFDPAIQPPHQGRQYAAESSNNGPEVEDQLAADGQQILPAQAPEASPVPSQPLQTQGLSDTNQVASAFPSPVAKTYAMPLMEAIREFRLKDIPKLVDELKTQDTFDWEDFMMVRPSDECEKFKRSTIHYLVSLVRKDTIINDKDRSEAIQSLLEAAPSKQIAAKALNTADGTGTTALHDAVVFRPLHMIKILLFHGADLNVMNKTNGLGPLHLVALNPAADEITPSLIEKGAELNVKDNIGCTPLHWAASSLRLKTVLCLLGRLKGADRCPYDSLLQTPLDLARKAAEQALRWVAAPGGNSREKGTVTDNEVVRLLLEAYGLNKDARQAYCYIARQQQQKQQPQNDLNQLNVPRTTILWSHISYRPPKLEEEVLGDSDAWLTELRKHRVQQGATNLQSSIWDACWIHLPFNDMTSVKAAAKRLFTPELSLCAQNATGPTPLDHVLDFIDYMESGESRNLTRPGFYVPDDPEAVRAVSISCTVVPILDINSSAEHVRQPAETPRPSFHVQEQEEESHKTSLFAFGTRQRSFPEQSLDEYCYEFLEDADLNKHDKDQVMSRYLHWNPVTENKASDSGQSKKRIKQCAMPWCCLTRSDAHCEAKKDSSTSGRSQGNRHSMGSGQESPENHVEILVVSRLWVWVLGDVVITSYGGNSTKDLRDVIYSRCVSSLANMNSATLSATTGAIVRCVLQECIKREPFQPGSRVRLLDGAGAFSSGIAKESSNVADFYEKFEESLMKNNMLVQNFKGFIKNETDCLRKIDDILSELAMIRRVQEDIAIVCTNYIDDDNLTPTTVERWIKQGKSKRERLEDEASRVRQSLVTLLSFQQREVNTEDLISSQFQNKLLFVFTVATILFTPLSWVTSLMALSIENFTPKDWSRTGAATAMSVTVVGSVVLMILGMWGWDMVEKRRLIRFQREHKRTSHSQDNSDANEGGRLFKLGLCQRRLGKPVVEV